MLWGDGGGCFDGLGSTWSEDARDNVFYDLSLTDGSITRHLECISLGN